MALWVGVSTFCKMLYKASLLHCRCGISESCWPQHWEPESLKPCPSRGGPQKSFLASCTGQRGLGGRCRHWYLLMIRVTCTSLHCQEPAILFHRAGLPVFRAQIFPWVVRTHPGYCRDSLLTHWAPWVKGCAVFRFQLIFVYAKPAHVSCRVQPNESA